VISKTTARFRTLYQALPRDIQRQAKSTYQLFKQNPRHPSLQFKPVSTKNPALYSARVGAHYRAIGSLWQVRLRTRAAGQVTPIKLLREELYAGFSGGGPDPFASIHAVNTQTGNEDWSATVQWNVGTLDLA
jgi:mRNA-degrading endonuclease RelE of RelBE toxin-antitoxin system